MAAKNRVGQEKSERRTRVGKVPKNWKTGSNRVLCRFHQRCEHGIILPVLSQSPGLPRRRCSISTELGEWDSARFR